MEEGTAAVEEVFTEAAAADFMEAAVDSTVEEDSPAAAALDSAVDIPLAGIVAGMEAADTAAATTVAEATMVDAVMDGAAEATAGAAEVGAEGMVTVTAGAVGAGDLVTAGRIGDMVGAIRMVITATAPGITRPTVLMATPRMDLHRIP
jgi:hypothetical protein